MNAISLLNPVPLSEVLPIRAVCYCTMNAGLWDRILQGAYEDGWVLLVLDDQERPIRDYRKAVACG